MLPNVENRMFLDRFQKIRRQHRQALLIALGAALLLAVSAIILAVAAADYRWELSAQTRAAGLIAGATTMLAALGMLAWSALSRLSARGTAADLEEAFPLLGQRVRTTVQFSDQSPEVLRETGVHAGLLTALSTETVEVTDPLPLESVVPRGRAWGLAALALAVVSGLAASPCLGWEWRTALSRALLSNTPYTLLQFGDEVVIREGEAANIAFDVEGRVPKEVSLFTRVLEEEAEVEASWTEKTFDPSEGEKGEQQMTRFCSLMTNVKSPVEYYVVAGKVRSDVRRVRVKYPISITSVTAEVTYPAYTALPPKSTEDGNITALVGSNALVTIQLDREPAMAEMVLTRLGTIDEETETRERRVPLSINGRSLTAELSIEHDLTWSVIAKGADGMEVDENHYRVRVRTDQPPQVGFEAPSEQLEVHTLAEIPMRVKASDDFGLARSGLVFQINNGEEHTLLEEDFQAVAAAATELAATGSLVPQTRATLERLLPLEYFGLTQKDCVVYYAFAEDNLPEAAQRTESDLRFIDIRPFKTLYRIRDPGEGGGDGSGRRSRVPALDELISRERYTLNRTIQANKRGGKWSDKDLGTLDRMIEYQAETADLTRLLAEQLIEREIVDDADTLFQAESAMLAAVDSLTVGNFEGATLQEKDAQQYLVEARNQLEVILQEAQNRGLSGALTRVNRAVMQKLRRDQQNNADNPQQQLLQQLVELVRSEEDVARQMAMLSGQMNGQMNGANGMTPNGTAGQSGGQEKQTPPPKTSENLESPESTGDVPPQEPMPGDVPSPESNLSLTVESENDGIPAAMPEGEPAASGELPADGQPADGQVDPQQLEERQNELVADAQELVEAMQGQERITDLANERMAAIAAKIDAAAGTMSRGDTPGAAQQTDEASEMLNELVRHVSALLESEAPQRVAAARNMAAELAERERQLAGQLAGTGDGSEPMPQGSTGGASSEQAEEAEEQMQENQEQAEQVAALTQTLADVLRDLATNTDADSVQTTDRVAEFVEEQQVQPLLARVEAAAAKLGKESAIPVQAQVEVELQDTADRVELAARDLNRIYRSIVTPRIEQLRQLEQQTAGALEQMEQLETREQANQVGASLEELFEELEKAGAGGTLFEELKKEWGQGTYAVEQWQAGAGDAYITAPSNLTARLKLLDEDLLRVIQELVLIDVLADRAESSPPQFDRFIERYSRVLSELNSETANEASPE